MSLRSRFHDQLKSLDAGLGVALGKRISGVRRRPPTAPRDALVIRLWGLGNLALLAPHLVAARGRVHIRLLTFEGNGEFVRQQFPWVEPLLLPEPTAWRSIPKGLASLVALKRASPDVIVDLEQFLRLPLLAARQLTGAPCVGLDTPGQGRAPLLDLALAHDPTRHVADTFAAIWRAAGLPTGRGPGPIAVQEDSLAGLPVDRRQGGRPFVVLHPGSGDHFPGRRWPAERFGRLARALQRETGAQVFITGLDSERRLVRRVLETAEGSAQDLCGQLDTRQLLALLARADLLVTNDTGPLHMADGVGTRSVALYGPNTPHRYGPRLPGSRSVYADLPCSPCLDDRSMKRSHCTHFACMLALDEQTVRRACLQVLDLRIPVALRSKELARAVCD